MHRNARPKPVKADALAELTVVRTNAEVPEPAARLVLKCRPVQKPAQAKVIKPLNPAVRLAQQLPSAEKPATMTASQTALIHTLQQTVMQNAKMSEHLPASVTA